LLDRHLRFKPGWVYRGDPDDPTFIELLAVSLTTIQQTSSAPDRHRPSPGGPDAHHSQVVPSSQA